MTPAEPSEGPGQEAGSSVAALFKSGGWQVDRRPDRHAGGPDLIIRRNGQVFMVEIKALAEGRADRALPLLSLAILQAKAHSREVKGARPLAVLQVGHASPSLAKHVRSRLGASRDSVMRLNDATFSKVTDDLRTAARIPQDRRLAPEDIQVACQPAFEQIFGR